MRVLLTLSVAVLLTTFAVEAQPSRPENQAAAIKRGVAFLTREVPRWHAEHGCYSCHNNGDATRALIAAGLAGFDIGSAVDDTTDFLRVPSRWDQNKGPAGFDDRVLARLQFAGALAVAARAGKAPESTLIDAAKLVAADQQADGSWTLEASKNRVSPATYGTLLATWSARTTLVAAGREPDDFSIVQIDRFFRGVPVDNVLDAAAVTLGLDVAEDVMAENLRAKCLGILREAQAPSGGWGPSSESPRVFDTALSVLALGLLDSDARLARKMYRPEELREAIARGRDYLVSQQRPDGSWADAAGGASRESYAQRISTTAWAILALLR